MNITDITVPLQQVILCGQMIMGLEFILLAAKLTEYKMFALLGISITILSLMAGIDIFLLPASLDDNNHGITYHESWELGYQVLACVFLFVLIWLNRLLLNEPSRNTAKIHSWILVLTGLAFIIDIFSPRVMFMEWINSSYKTTKYYDYLFAPYTVFLFLWLILKTVRGVGKAADDDKRTLKALCIAYILLACAGGTDFIIMINVNMPNVLPNFVEFGILGMGIVGTFIFTDRMLVLFSKQTLSLLRIEQVNGALVVHQPMRQLGLSAAEVTKEIQSQVSNLKKDVLKLSGIAIADYPFEVNRIEKVRNRLEKYTAALLDFSTCSRLENVETTSLKMVIGLALEKIPSEYRGKILVSGLGADLISANQGKLARALFEFIKNSIEAKAEKIVVRLITGLGMVSICIEDDGQGLNLGDMERICLPFFTTHKDEGAIGLGAAIANGIIHAHGGAVRFYQNNNAESRSGILVNILLPLEKGNSSLGPKNTMDCLLISNRSELVNDLLTICRNIDLRLTIIGMDGRTRIETTSSTKDPSLVIIDYPQMGEESMKGIFASAYLYCIGSGGALHPIMGRGRKGLGDRLPLCEETFIRILDA